MGSDPIGSDLMRSDLMRSIVQIPSALRYRQPHKIAYPIPLGVARSASDARSDTPPRRSASSQPIASLLNLVFRSAS